MLHTIRRLYKVSHLSGISSVRVKNPFEFVTETACLAHLLHTIRGAY